MKFIDWLEAEESKEKKEKIKIPRDIYLVAHFTRSDIPGFIDFKDDKLGRDKLNLSNVRNSFVSVRKDVDVQLGTENDIDVSIKLRDTLHLAPEKAKSLRDLGEILGKSKLDISINDLDHRPDPIHAQQQAIYEVIALDGAADHSAPTQ